MKLEPKRGSVGSSQSYQLLDGKDPALPRFGSDFIRATVLPPTVHAQTQSSVSSDPSCISLQFGKAK